MKSVYAPIKDNQRLERILEYFKKTSFKNYFFSVCALNTGVYLGDLLNLRITDVVHSDCFTNEKNGFRYYFDKDMKSMLKKYVRTLPAGSIYLFPSKRDASAPAALQSVSRQFRRDAERIGESICHIQFIKTFAFQYFIEHGNLKATSLCYPGTDIGKILNYLCMTYDEYEVYKKYMVPESRNIENVVDTIRKTGHDVDAILKEYAYFI